MDVESDWEYEYDENEPEDFYFTLDLTTHVPDAVVKPQATRNGRLKPILHTSVELASSERATPAEVEPGRLQLLDLHTENPFVKFNDAVYSCNWNTDLGTQIHVASRGAIADPVRKGFVLDVVGTSRTRLLARPVTLKQRSDWVDLFGPEVDNCVEGHDVPAGAPPRPPPSDLSTLRPGQQLVVPADAIKNPVMAAQASFFERLSAIKLKKGEDDIIPVGAVKHYIPPPNREEIRQRALAAVSTATNLTIEGVELCAESMDTRTATAEVATSETFGNGTDSSRKRSYGEMAATHHGDDLGNENRVHLGPPYGTSQALVTPNSTLPGPWSDSGSARQVEVPQTASQSAPDMNTMSGTRYATTGLLSEEARSHLEWGSMDGAASDSAIPWHALPRASARTGIGSEVQIPDAPAREVSTHPATISSTALSHVIPGALYEQARSNIVSSSRGGASSGPTAPWPALPLVPVDASMQVEVQTSYTTAQEASTNTVTASPAAVSDPAQPRAAGQPMATVAADSTETGTNAPVDSFTTTKDQQPTASPAAVSEQAQRGAVSHLTARATPQSAEIVSIVRVDGCRAIEDDQSTASRPNSTIHPGTALH
ncbi:hypothetical protein LTR62_001225 [Meristemomyces frigidus]|uniref:Transcription factor TFIIIC triple barrel domain-containing protein n=1 Tax=Meristemomyces frigidus TaxID=1508187 RepID=A0AAN7TNW7_9PEZI|nr:hypothetical protein LTR62_001225 [Meristemomyces frigidus]